MTHFDGGGTGMEQLISGSSDILQLVTFTLGKEEYAVDILKVQEINRMTEIARVPNAPDYVEGVINLRGRVIPVVSLRGRFGMPDRGTDSQSRIMIMDIQGITIGLVVDSVSEVLRIPADTVDSTPAMATAMSTDFITGIAKLEDRLIILLDLDKLIERQESHAMLEATAQAAIEQ
jgi:purine-binding chemotaxis protein CheW